MELDPEQLRSAEEAGLTVVGGSVAFEESDLIGMGIDADSTGDAIVGVSVRLAELLDLDFSAVASALADVVEELKWAEEQ